MIVKICGLTSVEDAVGAVLAGADILGFNFYPGSSRCIEVEQCLEMQAVLGNLDTTVKTAGIFVNDPLARIESVVLECGLDFAQLSGDEPPEYTHHLNSGAIRAIRLKDHTTAVSTIQAHSADPPPRFLIDSYSPDAFGGTGETGDWDTARRLAENYPILLAGGLNPDNVRQAVDEVQPWGVDVASGVEASPGEKDRRKMQRFVQAARGQV